MKITTKVLLLAATACASALLFAQDGPPPGRAQDGGPRGPGGPDGQGGPRHRMPPIAIIGALDANHDGVIDADEIANAVAALKKLDKNGDGKLTPDEFIGPRPAGPGGPGSPGGQRGFDREGGPRGPGGHRPEGENGPNERPPRAPEQS